MITFSVTTMEKKSSSSQLETGIISESYNEALAFLEIGDYPRASLAFRNACDIEPSHKQEIEKLSQHYRSKGEVNKAVFLYSVYLRL